MAPTSPIARMIVAMRDSFMAMRDSFVTIALGELFDTLKSGSAVDVIAEAALEDPDLVPCAAALLCTILLKDPGAIGRLGHTKACLMASISTDCVPARVVLMKDVNSAKTLSPDHFSNFDAIVDCLQRGDEAPPPLHAPPSPCSALIHECIEFMERATTKPHMIDDSSKCALLTSLLSCQCPVDDTMRIAMRLIEAVDPPTLVRCIQASGMSRFARSAPSTLRPHATSVIKRLTDPSTDLAVRKAASERLIDLGFCDFLLSGDRCNDFLHADMGLRILKTSFERFCDRHGGVHTLLSFHSPGFNIYLILVYARMTMQTFNLRFYNVALDFAGLIQTTTNLKPILPVFTRFLNESIGFATADELHRIKVLSPQAEKLIDPASSTMINEYILNRNTGPAAFDKLKDHAVFRDGSAEDATRACALLLDLCGSSHLSMVHMLVSKGLPAWEHLIPPAIRVIKDDKLAFFHKAAIAVVSVAHSMKPEAVEESVVRDIDAILKSAIAVPLTPLHDIWFVRMSKELVRNNKRVRDAFRGLENRPLDATKGMKAFVASMAAGGGRRRSTTTSTPAPAPAPAPAAATNVAQAQARAQAQAAIAAADIEAAEILASLNRDGEFVVTQADLDAAAAEAARAVATPPSSPSPSFIDWHPKEVVVIDLTEDEPDAKCRRIA